jgi:uncharacterized Zn finger protein
MNNVTCPDCESDWTLEDLIVKSVKLDDNLIYATYECGECGLDQTSIVD